MYLHGLGIDSDTGWSIDCNALIKMFSRCTDLELIMECELLSECYRALQGYESIDFEGVPMFLFILDSYERCLFVAVVKRFVDSFVSSGSTNGVDLTDGSSPA